MARNYDPSKVQRFLQYTRGELADLFNVIDGTITNWRSRGLQPVDDQRPQIFSGHEVRRFLTQRQFGNRSEPKDGKLYCINCFRYRFLKLNSIQHQPDSLRGNQLRGDCTVCDSPISIYAANWQLADIYRAAANNAPDSSADHDDLVSSDIVGLTTHIFPETNKSNLRIIFGFQTYLLEHEGFDLRTVDEYLRSLAKMSFVARYKSFKEYKIDDPHAVKKAFREIGPDSEKKLLALTTIDRSLNHCERFFEWLARQENSRLPPDLPGYFRLSLREKRIASDAVKGTEFSFEQALQILETMPASSSVEIRNRAIVALFIMTGIRAKALTTLRGKHVNTDTFWVFQIPPEVQTKANKNIRSYCLPISSNAREALLEWANLRLTMGFSGEDAFFLPDCYLKANAIGLGQRMPGQQIAECWRSTDAVSKIIRTAADVAGFKDVQVGAHDFRKAIHPFLARNGEMDVKQETAIQLNFGHTPSEVIKKNYTNMPDLHRQEYLDELCRAALGRSNTALVLAYERGIISINDPDYSRAQGLHKKATNKWNKSEVRNKLSDHLPHYGNDESKTLP